MKDFSFQGKVYLGRRGSDGKPEALRWVGDASQLQIQLSTDTEERQESWSGKRLTSVRLTKSTKAEFTLTLNDFSVGNLALALGATEQDVATGTVTAESFPASLEVGDIVALDHRDVSDVVISDSTSGTPATLVEGTDYAIESAAGGLIKVLSLGTTPYTQPFTAAYSYAATARLPLFTAGASSERYILLDGLNTVDQTRARVRLYRGSFDPASQLDLITDSLSSLEMKGSVLFDQVNAADANLGGFGRIELPGEAA
ncbi:MAG TPA: hypothetical protein VFJ01_06205 [Oleiagrimonas sp.]|nr:hypothetical protein [Oleiagrimonas sp.]